MASGAGSARTSRRRPDVSARVPWPVVPRTEEDQAVAVVAQHGWSVALVGAPGLGKSVAAGRITRRVEALDTDGRVLVVPITAVPQESTMPFAAISGGLGDLPAEVLTDAVGAERHLREAADLVDRDLVLRVDDADLLDPISARYVAWLVRNQGVRLVLTCRDFTALAEPLRDLWQDDLLERIDLRPLDVRETSLLLELTLDAPLETASVERVHRATQGNPLYLREVVRAAIASGALEHTASGWYWRGRITASNSLADMYRTELGTLPDDQRDVVDIVALADPIPLSRLLALVGATDVDRVVTLGLVRVETLGQDGVSVVRPSHPLVGEVVRALVPVARRTRLFARANAFRADAGADAPPAARLRATLWALECGVAPPTAQVLDAATVAVRLQEYDGAVGLATAALASDETARTPSERVAALCLRAVATIFSVGREAARADAEDAWSLARERSGAVVVDGVLTGGSALVGDDRPAGTPVHVVDDALVVEAAETLANIRQFHDDDVDAALALTDEAAKLVGPVQRERLRVLRLAHLGWGGRFAEVRSEIDRSGIVHAPTVPVSFLPMAGCAVMALATAGRLDDAMTLGRAALATAAARIEDAPWAVGELMSVMHQAQMWLGDIDGLFTQVSIRRTNPFFKYDFTLELLAAGNLAIAQRRWEDAVAAFSAACERFDVLDHGGFAAYPWARLAMAQAFAGRAEEASASLLRARTTPLRGMRMAGEQIAVSTAWTETVLGRPIGIVEAESIAERAAADGSWTAVMLARGLQFANETHQGRDPGAAMARMREAALRVDGPLARAVVRYADALAVDDRTAIADAQTELAVRGMSVNAGSPKPQLTTREYEVATLAAQGLSNRRIAEQLGRSVRTIDAHMSRVFAKWDLHARSELTELL